MRLSELELEIIADSLANFHDWDMEQDLRFEFIDVLVINEVNLTREQMSKLYDKFMAIEVKERFSISFRHRQFVEQFLEDMDSF